jgi:hypothetical protein
MQTGRLAVLTVFILAAPAIAEMEFPQHERQSKEFQSSWEYKITRTQGSNPSFSVTIPPKAAAKCSRARVCIRNTKNRLLAQFDVTPTRQSDGSIIFTMALFEDLDGSAELIVYTDLVQGAIPLRNFGGFTFKAKVEKQ